MWVLDGGKNALFAYDLPSGERLTEYSLDPSNDDPRGLWSDGVSLWVSDDGSSKRLFAYRLPVPSQEERAADAEPPALERVGDENFDRAERRQQQQPARHLVRRRRDVRRRRERRPRLQLQHARRDRRPPRLADPQRRGHRRVLRQPDRVRERCRRGRHRDDRRGDGSAERRRGRDRPARQRRGRRRPPGRRLPTDTTRSPSPSPRRTRAA